MSDKVVSVGPLATTFVLSPVNPKGSPGEIVDCSAQLHPSGFAYDVALQCRQLGSNVCPVMMTGKSGTDIGVKAQVESALRGATWWRCLMQSPVSVALGPRTYAIRAAASSHVVPAEVGQVVGEGKVTVIAPMTPSDFPLVAMLVRLAPRSILTLSDDQIEHPVACSALVSAAGITVLTQTQIEHLTGLSDPIEAIRQVRERGAGNIVVIGGYGLMCFLDGDWYSRPSYATEVTKQEGAQAVFVGTFAAALTQGLSWKQSLEFGAASIALHAAGENAGEVDSLRKIVQHSLTQPAMTASGHLGSSWGRVSSFLPSLRRRPLK
jgi:nucleotide-binding universal stress UspA family protein